MFAHNVKLFNTYYNFSRSFFLNVLLMSFSREFNIVNYQYNFNGIVLNKVDDFGDLGVILVASLPLFNYFIP